MGYNSQKSVYKKAGATARSTKWYIVNDQMVNELIFDILDYRKKSSFLPKRLHICKICSTFAADLVKINAGTRKNFQLHRAGLFII